MFKTDLDKLRENLEESRKLQDSVKRDIFQNILSLKSDSKIKKISENIFVMKASDLSMASLSPEYYNTESQAIRIVKELEKSRDILEIKRKIDILVSQKKLVYSNYTIYLNDTVISKLKEIQGQLIFL